MLDIEPLSKAGVLARTSVVLDEGPGGTIKVRWARVN
jgi:hypothetical protein